MQRKFAAAGRRFVRMLVDEFGGESLEYGLVGGAVVVVSYTCIESVGQRVTSMWRSLDQALSAF